MEKKKEGVLLSFLDMPVKRHGYAMSDEGKKRVFLPGANMRKFENGTWRSYELGEKRPVPSPRARVIMDICPDGRGYMAPNWALQN